MSKLTHAQCSWSPGGTRTTWGTGHTLRPAAVRDVWASLGALAVPWGNEAVSHGTESTPTPGPDPRQEPKQARVQLSLSRPLLSVLSPVPPSLCSLAPWKSKREGERDQQRQRDGEVGKEREERGRESWGRHNKGRKRKGEEEEEEEEERGEVGREGRKECMRGRGRGNRRGGKVEGRSALCAQTSREAGGSDKTPCTVTLQTFSVP